MIYRGKRHRHVPLYCLNNHDYETTLRFVFIRKGRKSEYPEMIGIVLS